MNEELMLCVVIALILGFFSKHIIQKLVCQNVCSLVEGFDARKRSTNTKRKRRQEVTGDNCDYSCDTIKEKIKTGKCKFDDNDNDNDDNDNDNDDNDNDNDDDE